MGQGDIAQAPPLTLTLSGALTIYEAARLKDDLLTALARTTRLAVDLGGVDEMDTAGLQLLLLARREAQRSGKAFHLQACSAAVREVLDRYQLAALFAACQQPHPEEPQQ